MKTAQPDTPLGSTEGYTQVQPAYQPGTHYQDSTWTFKVDQGNGSIAAVSDYEGGGAAPAFPFQTSFSPPVVKDNTKTFTVTWRRTWGRTP